ncbi:MAG: arylsulfatase [Planctomycetes bacterium]|nr:arylsulfatase [Planctomycetota bacterium]
MLVLAAIALKCALGPSPCMAAGVPPAQPNILLIVADDLGYSDLGCFGGEIKTPNLDALAARGLRAANFCVSATCSPSRAMLLTGTDNHIAGLGNMAEWLGPTQKGMPGYEGHLNARVVTIATLLSTRAGYFTFMAGKWHLGEDQEAWPAARGFARDFTIIDGMGSHWEDMKSLSPKQPRVNYSRNGERLDALPPGYFSSTNFTDFAIQCIDEARTKEKPFFAYVAYQAPHGPLAAPEAWIDKYLGAYDKGYDVIGAERLARQKSLGIVAKEAQRAPRPPGVPAWDELTTQEKQRSACKMEIYAAMVGHMDDQIGRLLGHLKTSGQVENTLIIFMSDNGANGEDHADLLMEHAPQLKPWFEKTYDNRFENWGRPGSFIDYGKAWGQVSNVPFRQFKGTVAEGGIRAPLIVSGPGVVHAGAITNSPLHIMDIAPTLLELAHVDHPAKEKDSGVAPPQGKSMWNLLANRENAIRADSDWNGWELFGNRAIRQGDWKLVYLLEAAGGTGDWQLFNLENDPVEMHDLSSHYPARRDAMLRLWDEYVKANGVIESDAGPFAKRDR